MASFIRLTAGASALDPATRILKHADYEAHLQAERILDEARQQAEARLAEAERDYARRHQEGYEDGVTEAKLEMSERMLATVERTVDYLGQLEHKVVDLVMMSMRKILGEFDETELTRTLVREALQVVRNQPQATIRVRPAQAESLRAQLNALLAGYTSLGMVEVVADPRLPAGGCILETEIGVVEASLETQLQAIEKALRSRLTRQGEAS